jgi:hypothetical protein
MCGCWWLRPPDPTLRGADQNSCSGSALTSQLVPPLVPFSSAVRWLAAGNQGGGGVEALPLEAGAAAAAAAAAEAAAAVVVAAAAVASGVVEAGSRRRK